MFCKNCGTEINDYAAFCKNCGTKIEVDKSLLFSYEIKKYAWLFFFIISYFVYVILCWRLYAGASDIPDYIFTALLAIFTGSMAAIFNKRSLKFSCIFFVGYLAIEILYPIGSYIFTQSDISLDAKISAIFAGEMLVMAAGTFLLTHLFARSSIRILQHFPIVLLLTVVWIVGCTIANYVLVSALDSYPVEAVMFFSDAFRAENLFTSTNLCFLVVSGVTYTLLQLGLKRK